MGCDHVEVTLVDREVDGFADRPSGMVEVGEEIGQLDEVLEVLE